MKGSAYAVHFDMKLLDFYISQKTHTLYLYIFELTFIHLFYLNFNTWKVSTTNFVAFFHLSIFNDFFFIVP